MTGSDFVNRPPPTRSNQIDANRRTPPISSRNNAFIKRVRSLRLRKYREQSGLFFAEGALLVTQALRLHAPIETLIAAPTLIRNPQVTELIEAHLRCGGACLEVTAEVWNSLAAKENTGGIGAVVRQRWDRLASVRLQRELCWVVLDSTEFPGNLGTILRTLDAVGGAGVMLLGNTADPYDPAAVSASRGAIFSQRLVRATFAEFARWKLQHGYVLVGASLCASRDYRTSAYPSPLLLFMGGEQHGLSPEQQGLCDINVRIPMIGACDSLNLGVATGILLYEIFRHPRDDVPWPGRVCVEQEKGYSLSPLLRRNTFCQHNQLVNIINLSHLELVSAWKSTRLSPRANYRRQKDDIARRGAL